MTNLTKFPSPRLDLFAYGLAVGLGIASLAASLLRLVGGL